MCETGKDNSGCEQIKIIKEKIDDVGIIKLGTKEIECILSCRVFFDDVLVMNAENRSNNLEKHLALKSSLIAKEKRVKLEMAIRKKLKEIIAK